MHFSASLLLVLVLVLLTVTFECGQSHDRAKAPKGGQSRDCTKAPKGGQSHGHAKTTPEPHSNETPISILVTNSVNHGPNKTYSTYVVYRGILLGAMRRLQNSDANFKFTYSEDQNYGPFLESVNGLAGNFTQHTYWQLKVEKPDGTVIIPDVGIGCYIPTANDEIILNYSSY